MKKIAYLNLFLFLALVLGSCSTSNNVVNNRLISKRKYTKGFHYNKKSDFKAAKGDVAIDDVEKDNDSSIDPSTWTFSAEANDGGDVQETADATFFEFEDDLVTIESSEVNSDSESVVRDKVNSKSKKSTKKSGESSTRKKESKKRANKKNQGGSSGDVMFILAVIFAILLPPLGVLIYTSIDWMKVLIALLLTLLFFLPGMIYALLVVFDVI